MAADTAPGNAFSTEHWPLEIVHKAEDKVLEIAFDNGATFRLPAEFLRVESPSAEVKGHGPGQETLVTGRRHVGIMEIEAVGNYAIRISFDDLHDTGIFSWSYLYELGADQERLWQAYLARIKAAGASRDP